MNPDLVVVGCGNAGLAAAVTASELGLRTVVVEKTDRLGGQLHWSSGHFSAAGTRRQRQRGIDDGLDLHFRDVMAIGHHRNTAALVRLAVEAAPLAVDWLENLGFPFSPETPTTPSGHEAYSRPRTYWGGPDPLRGGSPLFETLAGRIDPAQVEIRTGTRVERLVVRSGDGGLEVRGVVIEDGSGRRELAGRSVVLATGGYAASRQMLATLQPEFAAALTGCLDHATGDGHAMLVELGAQLTHSDTYLPTMGMIEDPDRPGFGLPIHQARVIVNAADRSPWEVWVNRRGERFVAEDVPSPYRRERALLAQPDLTMYVIWDQAVAEVAPPVIGPGWTSSQVAAEARRGRWLHRSETLEGLAEGFGLPVDRLQATLDAYGRAGPDPLGRRHRPLPIERPPFYGVRVVGGMLLSRGGPRVDEHLRPLDEDGRPIRGLYAVGELLGMGQFSGDSFASGMSVGPALALGRWVVQQVAAGLRSR
jgi:fumarate reductase flavoprotein subunit